MDGPREAHGRTTMGIGYAARNDGWRKLHNNNVIATETGPSPFQLGRPANMRDMRGVKSVRMAFLGDTDNDDFSIEVYGVDSVGSPDAGEISQYKSELLGTVRVVVGAGVGEGPVDQRHVGLLDLYADTITSWSAAPILAKLAAYWNIDGAAPTVQLLSPLGDGYGELMIGSTFGYTWFAFILSMFNKGDAGNVLMKLDRLGSR